MNKLFSKIAALTLGLGLAVGVGVAINRGAQKVVADGTNTSDILDATALDVTTTALTSETEKTYDYVTYVLSSGLKLQNVDKNATKNLSDEPTIIFPTDSYIYNKTALPGSLVSLEVYLNKGSSTATTAYVSYGTSMLTEEAEDAEGTALSTADHVFDITGSGEGKTFFRIDVTSASDKKAQLQIKVTYSSRTLNSVTVTGTLTKTEYFSGQSFDPTGLTFTAHYSDGDEVLSAQEVENITWAALKAGDTSVVGTYKSANFTVEGITVIDDYVTTLAIAGSMTKTKYYVGDNWNPAGLTVSATYAGKGETDVTKDVEWSYDPASASDTSTTSVKATASFGEKTAFVNCSVTVNANTNPVLVTKADTLNLGDRLYFVSGNKAAGELSSDYLTSKSVTIEDGVMSDKGDAIAFDLGVNANGYTFKYDDAYLGTTAAKKVSFSAGVISWTISLNNSNEAIITSTNASNGSIQYNTASPRFTTYATAQTAIQLYRVKISDEGAVAEFRNGYLHMNDYTESKGWCADKTHNYYAIAKAAYNVLTVAQKALLSEADLLRLAAWAEANGEKFENGEFITTSSPVGQFTSAQPGPVILIIMGTVAALSFGIVAVLKTKKKEK